MVLGEIVILLKTTVGSYKIILNQLHLVSVKLHFTQAKITQAITDKISPDYLQKQLIIVQMEQEEMFIFLILMEVFIQLFLQPNIKIILRINYE